MRQKVYQVTKLQSKERECHQLRRALEFQELKLRITKEKHERRIVAEQARRSAAVSKIILKASDLRERLHHCESAMTALRGQP